MAGGGGARGAELAATADTAVLPALRELAGRVRAATLREWGRHPLELAAAFRAGG